MWLSAQFFILILTLNFYNYEGANVAEQTFSSIYNFIVEFQNSSNSMLEYFAKMQAVFCPDQLICSRDGVQVRSEVLSGLPKYIDVGNSSLELEDIHNVVGVCCLHCSCSVTCQENDNCCPSKSDFVNDTRDIDFVNDTRDAESVKSECIETTATSYQNKAGKSRQQRYFMITQCFADLTNSTLVTKCEKPSIYKMDETGPVTSLKTGRTYWNKYCALCNKDTDDIMIWNSTVEFSRFFFFFGNTTIPFSYPETFDELHKALADLGTIFYLPPLSMDDQVCIEKESVIASCREDNDGDVNGLSFLSRACQQYNSPVSKMRKSGLKWVYKNIFCYFCHETYLGQEESACNGSLILRSYSKQMTAVLDYRPERKEERKFTTNSEKSKCPCHEVFDRYLARCRPVFCPLGEFLIGCQCKQPLQTLSGMPVLLKLRSVSNPARTSPMTNAQMHKYHAALKTMMEDTVKDIAVEIIATFKQEIEGREYYVSMATAIANPGHDTIQTMKPFIAYLDGKGLSFKAGKISYNTNITSRVLLWCAPDIDPVMRTKGLKLQAKYLDGQSGIFTRIYQKSNLDLVTFQMGLIQILSPLLYCMQVKLNSSEFYEKDYRVIINTTSPTISGTYYYKVGGLNQVRVCVEQYLPEHKIKSKGSSASLEYTNLVVPFIWAAFKCLT